jgi:hypothetical protein
VENQGLPPIVTQPSKTRKVFFSLNSDICHQSSFMKYTKNKNLASSLAFTAAA